MDPDFFSCIADMSCDDFLDAAEKVTKIAVIFLGGAAAYYKFLRGRVFQPRMETLLSAALLLVDKQLFLKVTATVKNTGASRIPFDLEYSALEIFGGNHSHRKITDLTAWKKLATVDFTDKHKWIEPAETIQVHWMVDLPADDTYSVLKADLTIAGKKSFWKSDAIIERQPKILSEVDKEKPADAKEAERSQNIFSSIISFVTSHWRP